jgi:hypothetical protein
MSIAEKRKKTKDASEQSTCQVTLEKLFQAKKKDE